MYFFQSGVCFLTVFEWLFGDELVGGGRGRSGGTFGASEVREATTGRGTEGRGRGVLVWGDSYQ